MIFPEEVENPLGYEEITLEVPSSCGIGVGTSRLLVSGERNKFAAWLSRALMVSVGGFAWLS